MNGHPHDQEIDVNVTIRQLGTNVHALDKAVFGDREDPKGNPGLIAETVSMKAEQQRTNEILTEMRTDLKKAFVGLCGLVFTAIGTALLSLVLKH